MSKFRFSRNVILAKFLVLSPFFSSISADDTEIFFNIDRDISAPNILFILDDSGSMSTMEQSLSSNYDPAEDYDGTFDDDLIYYYAGGQAYSVRRSVIECADVFTKVDTSGFTSAYKMAFNFNGAWYPFNEVNVNYSRTVCEADGNTEPDWGDISSEVFYSGNYLNWYFNEREVVSESRLSIVQRVTKNLADGLENVNIGMMSFDWDNSPNEGGVIREAVRAIAEGRTDFKSAVDDLTASGNTPVAETLFGAKRYFQGGAPFLSGARNQASNSVSGGSYVSPIDLECQANYIVVLSDGVPTQDTNRNSAMERELGIDDCAGNCLDDIAEYMYSNDVNADYDGVQRVVTYTVGFNTDQTLLEDTARKGGGEYYTAENADQLTAVFNEIFRQVLSTNTTFSSPGVSVNNFNQLNFLDALYYSVFEPVLDPVWPGNLKRYRLTSEGKIVDVNGTEAVDPDTGFFRDTAKSFWSPLIDGAAAGRGGAASVIADANSERKVFTHYEGSASQSLTNSANALDVGNGNLTKAMFGDAEMSDERLQRLIRWTRGADVFDQDGDGSTADSRKFIGDPLHSRPFLQVYGGTEEEPDTTVFFGDNQGFLHALDGETGEIDFSFMPAELLVNQAVYMDNTRIDGPRPYGMDGSVVAWFKDIDGDRVVDADEDKVYIYSGMRRGGRNYYGLDVTDRSSPSVLWTIRGGSGDFAELGQTWSDAVKQRVRIGDDVKDVLFFSGGYDTNQDNVVVRTEDTMGRALYMVDATTGERLWWAGPTDSGANLELASMDYSIPATPAVIDVNRDGLADQLYVGDMGGQVWRVDFRHGQNAGSFASAGVIANLAGDDEASNRRFYHTPDLSGTLKNGQRYLNLAIGSGYQASPLEKDVEDRFYKLTISPVGIPLNEDGDVEYTTLTEADLFDTTDNLIQEGTETQRDAAETSLAQAQGWFIRLTRDGEKVLSTSTTLRGDVFFTTFEPAASLDPCVPSAGQSRLYHVDLADGRAVVNYDTVGADDALTESDRYVALKTLGLPPSPKAITIDGEDIIVAGTETLVPPPPGNLVRKIYWYEE